MRARARRSGLTLVEIMIVVSIIGIIIAIALPGFLRAGMRARTIACKASQTRMENAVLRWAAEQGKIEGAVPTKDDLIGSDLYLPRTPRCPSTDNRIAIHAFGERPTCPSDLPDHVFQDVPEE